MRHIESQVAEKIHQASVAMQEAKALMREYKGLLPGINHAHDPMFQRLPPEIISYIFQSSVPDIEFDSVIESLFVLDIRDALRDAKTRLVLGSVCRQWRLLAWSTPQLWTFFVVNLASPHLKDHVGLLRDWLGRSGKLPLSIRVYAEATTVLTPAVFGAITLINQECSRWQSLDLRIPSALSSLFVGDAQYKGPSILQSLRLQDQDDSVTSLKFSLLSAMPAPSELFLVTVGFKNLNIWWDNVTCFEAEIPYISDVFQLFRNAPRLQVCKLHSISEVVVDFPLPRRIVVHQQINNLTLHYPAVGVMHDLFSRIILPSLKQLHIKSGDEELAGEALASFLKRSSCGLETLILANTIYDTDELVGILNEVPSLVKLDVLFVDFFGDELPATGDLSPDVFFRLLAQIPTLDPSSTQEIEEPRVTFLPNLQYLSFGPLEHFSWDLLPPIFEPFHQSSRPKRPLESFYLYHYDHQGRSGGLPRLLMDKETTVALLAVEETQLDLGIYYDGSDYLRKSADHHGIPYNRDME